MGRLKDRRAALEKEASIKYLKKCGLAHSVWNAPALILSFLFLIIVFQTLNQFIKDHGDCAQNDNGCDDHVELEEMEGVSETDGHFIALWR